MGTDSDLALEGGVPVRETLLPYGRQRVTEGDIAAVIEVMNSDWLTTGPKGEEFEVAFAEYVGARFAVSFSSGTAALHGAVFAANLGPGDEAITSPLTFCATSNVLLYQGARPVFADVSGHTLNIDPDQVENRITSSTRAILPVDYAGQPVALAEILELAERYHLLVIEDASHAIGAEYRGRRVGSIADLTTFSFHPVKHITTGEGGMATTNDPGLARRLRLFRNHGIDSQARQRQEAGECRYQMVELGYNYRLNDMGAALGLSQLGRIEQNLARRRALARCYEADLQGIHGVRLLRVCDDRIPAWHIFPIRVELPKFGVGRDTLIRALRAEGIGVSVHFVPVHLHPYYRQHLGHRDGDYPIAEEASASTITLPLFHGMSDRDASDVIAAVHKVLGHYRT